MTNERIDMSDDIRNAGNKPWSDKNAKVVLSYKYPTAILLKSLIPEFSQIPLKEIIDSFLFDEKRADNDKITVEGIEVESTNLGERRFDIKITLKKPGDVYLVELGIISYYDGLIVDFEPQNKFPTELYEYNRPQYYTSSAEAEQPAHFDKLKKVYSIWIYLFPPEKRGNSIESMSYYLAPYHALDPLDFVSTNESEVDKSGKTTEDKRTNEIPHIDEDNVDLYAPSLTEMKFIYVGGPNRKNFRGVPRFLYYLLRERDPEKRIECMEKEYGWQMSKEEEETIMNLAIEQNDYFKSLFEEGRAEGLEEGRAEGLEEGVAKTEKKNQTEIAELKKEKNILIELLRKHGIAVPF